MQAVRLVTCLALLVAGCDDVKAPHVLPFAPTPVTAAPSPPVAPPPAPSPSGTGPSYKPGTGTMIVPGQVVHGGVPPGSYPCYPNWDASAVCVLYELTAPIDGTLDVTATRLTESDEDVMDLFLVEPSGAWAVAYEGRIDEHTTLPAKRGVTYGILVMSYARAVTLEFNLVADVRPN